MSDELDVRTIITMRPRRGIIAYRMEPQRGQYFAVHVLFSARLGAPVVDVVRVERPLVPTQALVLAKAINLAAQLATGDHAEREMARAAALFTDFIDSDVAVDANPWREQVKRSGE